MPGIQNSRGTLDFLGTIGTTDRGDDVSLRHTAKALVELGVFLMDTATRNLQKKGNVATGNTASSMKAKDIEIGGTHMSLDIEIASTYKFLDQGVKGVESGTGKYAFKTKRPGKKMALALLKWIKARLVATKYKAISKTERKNQKVKAISDAATSQKSLAYAMATNIKKHGIKPTHFFSDAVEATKKLQKKKYADAFKLDIIETLNSLN